MEITEDMYRRAAQAIIDRDRASLASGVPAHGFNEREASILAGVALDAALADSDPLEGRRS